jgi:hypothetical protein
VKTVAGLSKYEAQKLTTTPQKLVHKEDQRFTWERMKIPEFSSWQMKILYLRSDSLNILVPLYLF